MCVCVCVSVSMCRCCEITFHHASWWTAVKKFFQRLKTFVHELCCNGSLRWCVLLLKFILNQLMCFISISNLIYTAYQKYSFLLSLCIFVNSCYLRVIDWLLWFLLVTIRGSFECLDTSFHRSLFVIFLHKMKLKNATIFLTCTYLSENTRAVCGIIRNSYAVTEHVCCIWHETSCRYTVKYGSI